MRGGSNRMSNDSQYHYDFQEFLRHYRDIHLRREDVPDTFEARAFRVFEYMAPLYPDQDEFHYKVRLFMLILLYLASHVDDFDEKDFAVVGSEEVGALVSQHLLWAIHNYYTSRPLQSGHGPSPDLIRSLATQYKDREYPENAV